MGEWDIIDMMGAPDEIGENALRAAHDHPSVDVLEFDSSDTSRQRGSSRHG